MSEKVPFKEYSTQLAGTWELYSYLQYKDGQVVGKPHGDHPLGFAQVSAEGYSSSHLADPNRTNVTHPDRAWSAHSDAEIAHYSKGISMYCGQIELFKDDQGLFWKTKVDVSSDPSRIGGEQVRRVIFSEEDGKHVITLQPLNVDANVNGVSSILKWLRMVHGLMQEDMVDLGYLNEDKGVSNIDQR